MAGPPASSGGIDDMATKRPSSKRSRAGATARGRTRAPRVSLKPDLETIAEACRRSVHRRALVSAVGAAVPVPGIGLAIDLGVLMQMLDETNVAFGLTPAQIDDLAPVQRLQVRKVIETLGASTAGRTITRELLLALLRTTARRIAARSPLKVIPFAGPLLAGALSYSAVRLIGERHVSECIAARREIDRESRR